MHEFLEESKQAGVSAEHLRSLEGMIFEDQAQTEEEAGDFVSAERDYREAIAHGQDGCQICFAYMLMHEGKKTDARFRKAAAQGDEMGIRNLNTALAPLPAATGTQ